MEYQRASTATFSKKLASSDSHSFSSRSIYDGVLATPAQAKQRGTSIVAEDYVDIFRGSGSSIPVLQVPELNERKVVVNVRSSVLDYSKIFAGFGDSDFGVSHEDLFVNSNEGNGFSKEPRIPAETTSSLQESYPTNPSGGNQFLSPEASESSFKGAKEFNMSYHKTNQGNPTGTNGTTPVAQLHAIPGYTCLVDELQTSKGGMPVSTASHGNHSVGTAAGNHYRNAPSDSSRHGSGRQSSKGGDIYKKKINQSRSDSIDMLFNASEIGLGIPSSGVPPLSSQLRNLESNNEDEYDRSMASMFGFFNLHSSEGTASPGSPLYFDAEVDANSVAASSAAAVKKAIEEAQANLKFAREKMERKKEGLQSRVKLNFNNGIKTEERRAKKIKDEANKFRKEKAQEICDVVDSPLQVFGRTAMLNAVKAGQVAPNFIDREKLLAAEEAPGETHGENSSSTRADLRREEAEEWGAEKQGENEKKMAQSLNDDKWEENNMIKKSVENEEYGNKFKAVEEAHRQEVGRKGDGVKEAITSEFSRSAKNLESAPKVYDQEENDQELRVAREQEETDKKAKASYELELCKEKLKELPNPIENDRKLVTKDLEEDEILKRVINDQELVENEKQWMDVDKQEENDTRIEVIPQREENDTNLEEIFGQKENEKRYEESCERMQYEREQKDSFRVVEIEVEQKDVYMEKMSDKVHGQDLKELNHNNFHDGEESEEIFKDVTEDDELGDADQDNGHVKEVYQTKEMEKREDECEFSESETISTEIDQNTEGERMEMTEETLMCCEINFDVADNACERGEFENQSKTLEACRNVEDNEVEEVTVEVLACEENGGIMEVTEASFQCHDNGNESRSVEREIDLEEVESLETADTDQGFLELNEIKKQVKDTFEAHACDEMKVHSGLINLNLGQKQHNQHEEESKVVSNTEKHVEFSSCEGEENHEDVADEIAIKQEKEENQLKSSNKEGCINHEKNIEVTQLPSMSEEKVETTEVAHENKTSQRAEKLEENQREILTMEEREAEGTVEKELKLEKEHLRKIDEAKEREREKEIERLAVERAIREARERAFAEARERAERAAAERANAEVHRRMMAEGRKASAEASNKSSSEKAFMEAKLKAERAAVERATVEARERALEKAVSEKARKLAEKFQGSSTDNGTRKNFSVTDSLYNNSGTSKSSRCPSSSDHAANDESAERNKARFERHQRTTERAAKALAEKNMRDLLAQKEQAEKDRLAEALDAEIKRWSNGKEGNLRALLSTLQYILGTDGGWKPMPLTDIITTTAVKKAYRKATLLVHPDKLQQRGASIQQKYICEKVFDLLKEAWNKLNTDEP
ncbi:DnaJ domain-containing protein [Cephalotus follicularis]|uniref:DnaJ domain-containing protein n=1 Tax=Cephalotus follicularis TaxID=3775 RepID=A0A1Q3BCN7_CEPFO|nr:DnaJ domain-containing protein [Cephalotus follicularis]